jgi:hypothetical protein
MPCRPDAVQMGEVSSLTGWSDSADLAHMHPDEIDEPTLDEGPPFEGMIE